MWHTEKCLRIDFRFFLAFVCFDNKNRMNGNNNLTQSIVVVNEFVFCSFSFSITLTQFGCTSEAHTRTQQQGGKPSNFIKCWMQIATRKKRHSCFIVCSQFPHEPIDKMNDAINSLFAYILSHHSVWLARYVLLAADIFSPETRYSHECHSFRLQIAIIHIFLPPCLTRSGGIFVI